MYVCMYVCIYIYHIYIYIIYIIWWCLFWLLVSNPVCAAPRKGFRKLVEARPPTQDWSNMICGGGAMRGAEERGAAENFSCAKKINPTKWAKSTTKPSILEGFGVGCEKWTSEKRRVGDGWVGVWEVEMFPWWRPHCILLGRVQNRRRHLIFLVKCFRGAAPMVFCWER